MDGKRIFLGKGKFALVDESDYDYLMQWMWHYSTGYAIRNCRHGETPLMHRLLLNPAKGYFVDHINRERLDNRRANLRLCTMQENNINSKKKGVTYFGNRYYAQIMLNGKNYAKTFKDRDSAIVWYNQKARDLHGDFAVLIERSVL